MPMQYRETALQRLVTLLALAHAKHLASEKSPRNRFRNPMASLDQDAKDADFLVVSSHPKDGLQQQHKTQD